MVMAYALNDRRFRLSQRVCAERRAEFRQRYAAFALQKAVRVDELPAQLPRQHPPDMAFPRAHRADQNDIAFFDETVLTFFSHDLPLCFYYNKL